MTEEEDGLAIPSPVRDGTNLFFVGSFDLFYQLVDFVGR